MDFFAHQERAQRKTTALIIYLVLAVIMIIAAVYAAMLVIFGGALQQGSVLDAGLWHPDLFGYAAGGALLVILGGSAVKISELSGGGGAVATLLGGRPISPQSNDPDERKLRHVVEEMAIASGTPMPQLFVLEQEDGINAFAAGHSTRDMAIGVTKGCIRYLSRDELQGVIAHEYSHILHGDMRLNTRLMGLLFGILCLALIGRILLRTRGRRNPLPVLGLALIVIGGVGVFFGKLIKSAVSRQREFLADAASVQFTRNPDGIAGALKKIGGMPQGARLRAENAEEASHLFFANGLQESWLGLFATHPPLAERIRAIDSSFDGTFPKVSLQPASPPAKTTPPAVATLLAPLQIDAHRVVSQVGTLTPQHLRLSQRLLSELPVTLTASLHEPPEAMALIYALLLSPDDQVRQGQMKSLQGRSVDFVTRRASELGPVIQTQERSAKLLLVDLAVPALRQLSPAQYAGFMECVQELIEADQAVDLFEYTLTKVLHRQLQSQFEKVPPRLVQFRSLEPVLAEGRVLLSGLAYLGQEETPAAQAAFRAGWRELDVRSPEVGLLARDQCGLAQLDAALDRVAGLAPQGKKNLLHACAVTVAADGRIQSREAELLRAFAETLDCPLPPFVEEQVAYD